ncbi:MAG: DNA mismatch repair endonuclease MutL [gamma proteobacterium symbiont of Lucinoma myriamae]|nr:DNA mismatch repair endonuclease MutL [gamma proteobacterium symbiont of Lucinoma myriamae]MCU7817963.1 DNA mismatch repair endonuclease MutL [gamma proteobacterium symbiont of Lucinoma myriamae]MCU7832633.1 DNA mismatch repair endonuclease MutL [gamma proteobacterium symbiont of Lucinoma myriamae]
MTNIKFLKNIDFRSSTVSSRIKTLSLQLANQIAAGEVVERPASVVKELLENAIDAHSSQIQIEIERGGSALIRITDDGEGINKEDLALAVTRHATSKIKTLNELEQIISLGFRGEALASISAVSRLSLKSKQVEQNQAWMINTGTDSDFANYSAEPEPVAHPQGTTIDVRDLFFNTPARRKFMRTVKTEFKHIDDVIKRIALSRFDIAFKLTHNKKLLRNLPKAVTEKAIIQRISKLFSPEFLANTCKVDFSSNHFSNMGEIRLSGWVSTPQWNRKQSDWQYFYVNGRYIKDKLVNHALRQAYQELLPDDTFSAYLLYLEIDPQQVDVNVHPTKHEVRFRQTRLVHDFIYSGIKDALFPESSDIAEQAPTYAADNGEYINRYSQANYNKPLLHHYQPSVNSSLNQNKIAEQLNGLTQLYRSDKQDSLQKDEQKTMSTFFGTSLGCLIPNYLMSQSVNNEQQAQVFIIHIQRAQQFLLKQLFQRGQNTPLLIPETISLNHQQIASILEHQPALQQWGLELSQLGEDTLLVRKRPSLCNIPACKIDMVAFIHDVLQNITYKASIDESQMMEAFIHAITSESLNTSEQERLLMMLAEQIHQYGVEQAAMIKPVIWKTLDESSLDKLLT